MGKTCDGLAYDTYPLSNIIKYRNKLRSAGSSAIVPEQKYSELKRRVEFDALTTSW